MMSRVSSFFNYFSINANSVGGSGTSRESGESIQEQENEEGSERGSNEEEEDYIEDTPNPSRPPDPNFIPPNVRVRGPNFEFAPPQSLLNPPNINMMNFPSGIGMPPGGDVPSGNGIWPPGGDMPPSGGMPPPGGLPPPSGNRPPPRRPIVPQPFINADIGYNLKSYKDLPEYDYESDSDSIGEALNNGNLSAEFVVEELRRMTKSLKNMRRVEHSKLHSDNLIHAPRPSFPPETPTFRYKSLGIAEDFKIIEFNFPKVKFSGNPKVKKAFDMDVYEFLSIMVEGQKHCPVSKNDFLRILLMRLAPPALGMVKGWMLDPNCTINKICNRLYKTFGCPVPPRDAKEFIRKYLYPRNLSFDQALSEFQYLADLAGRGDRETRENALACVYAVQEGLEHSLPEQAYTICYEQILDLRRYYNREPYLGEVIDSLRQVSDKVDRVLKLSKNHNWGKSRDFLDFDFKNKHLTHQSSQGTSKSKKKKISAVHETNVQVNENYSKPNQGVKGKGQQGQQKPEAKGKQGKGVAKPKAQGPQGQQKQQQKKGQKVNSASGAKKYCCYCGANTHNAADGCWCILDDQMHQYEGPPAQESCKICIEKGVKKELKHPMHVCPLRPKMLALYKAKWVHPKGVFKAVLEEKDTK